MTHERLLGVCLALALIVAGSVAALESAAVPTKTRMIDRTMRCPVSLSGGLRLLSVNSQAGVRDQGDRSKWFALAHASIYLGSNTGSFAVQAGGPKSPLGQPQQQTTVWMKASACTPASVRVPLSVDRLIGGPSSQLLERYDCSAPARILVRVRAELRSPASLRLRSGTLFTFMPVKAGHVAVRTLGGKPLVYADVYESGKARLFLANHCQRD